MKKSLPTLAIFLTFALVCSYIESLIPMPFGVPGMKLGLTNVVIILLLYLFGPLDAIIVSILRVVLIGFMFGNVYSMCYSLAGAVISFIFMYILYRFTKFNMIAVSVVGGLLHNSAQLLVAIIFFDSGYLIYYLPALLITGVVTGAIIGVIAQAVYTRIVKIIHKDEASGDNANTAGDDDANTSAEDEDNPSVDTNDNTIDTAADNKLIEGKDKVQ